MNYFLYNNIKYELDSIVLLKFKGRILKYKIIYISEEVNNYHIIKFQSILYENVIHTIKFDLLKSNKFIKNYIMYNKPINIKCTLNRKKNHIIYSFKCDFCNIIHKHNNLGLQDCRCNCVYSPYYENGYNLILEDTITDFNEYLLYNFELYLKKYKYNGWSSYKLSIKKFYTGLICEDYGKTNFPYLTNTMINYVKTHYNSDNKKCSNGCLVAGLKVLKKMILKKIILYTDYKFKNEINKLYKFYKNIQFSQNEKIFLLKKIIKPNCLEKTIENNSKTIENNSKNIEINSENIETNNKTIENNSETSEINSETSEIIETNNKTIENNSKTIKTNNENIETNNETIEIIETNNENIKTTNENIETNNETIEIIENNINIKLDLDCGVTQIEELSIYHINKIKDLITIDYPIYKEKYFYYPEDIKIYSQYLNIYDDLYLCILKLETNLNHTIFCVDEVDCYDPDFINFRLNL